MPISASLVTWYLVCVLFILTFGHEKTVHLLPQLTLAFKDEVCVPTHRSTLGLSSVHLIQSNTTGIIGSHLSSVHLIQSNITGIIGSHLSSVHLIQSNTTGIIGSHHYVLHAGGVLTCVSYKCMHCMKCKALLDVCRWKKVLYKYGI